MTRHQRPTFVATVNATSQSPEPHMMLGRPDFAWQSCKGLEIVLGKPNPLWPPYRTNLELRSIKRKMPKKFLHGMHLMLQELHLRNPALRVVERRGRLNRRHLRRSRPTLLLHVYRSRDGGQVNQQHRLRLTHEVDVSPGLCRLYRVGLSQSTRAVQLSCRACSRRWRHRRALLGLCSTQISNDRYEQQVVLLQQITGLRDLHHLPAHLCLPTTHRHGQCRFHRRRDIGQAHQPPCPRAYNLFMRIEKALPFATD